MKQFLFYTTMTSLLVSCASIEKANLASSTPEMAIQEVESMQDAAQKNHGALIARSDYFNGTEALDEAKEDFNEGDDAKEIMDELAISKAYFEKVQKKVSSNNAGDSRILKARMNAINAGVYDNAELRDRLKDIDDDYIDETNKFTTSLSAKNFSNIQKRYNELEAKAVQHSELHQFRSIVEKAKRNDADDLAPRTYDDAKADIITAENAIAQNPRTPSEFESEVMEANKSAKLLQDVMDKLLGDAQGSPEPVALKLVYQERKLGKLNSTVDELQGELTNTQEGLQKTEKSLSQTNSELSDARQKVEFQNAMNAVRENFSSDEAEVYQQGNQLIIRLKDLKFKTGSAQLPGSSMSLLKKVDKIVENMDTSNIVIQGHTDSTGPESLNEDLSKERAQSVASYFKSQSKDDISIDTKGLGETRPLASNSTKEGRAMNRRVDIVIEAKDMKRSNKSFSE